MWWRHVMELDDQPNCSPEQLYYRNEDLFPPDAEVDLNDFDAIDEEMVDDDGNELPVVLLEPLICPLNDEEFAAFTELVRPLSLAEDPVETLYDAYVNGLTTYNEILPI
tara:strand:- start:132 stop:458 length:327 start_codon:yes stop_codon:yes gene_type:complete